MGANSAMNDDEDGGRHPTDSAIPAGTGKGRGIKLMKAASTKSFFKKSGSRRAEIRGLVSSARSVSSELVSSFQSDTSHGSVEKQGSDPTASSTANANPFNDIGARMKAALKGLRQGGKEEQLRSHQKLSRKIRNSDPSIEIVQKFDMAMCVGRDNGIDNGKSTPMGYMQLRAAHLTSSLTSESRFNLNNNALASKLLDITKKDHMCDVQIRGNDDVVVRAPSLLLACHSTVFEQMFFPKGKSKEDSDALPPHLSGMVSRSDSNNVHVDFATQSTIKAAIHFLATLELPSDIENELSEANIRTVSQLHAFGQLFKISSLIDDTYQTARRLINKDKSLACAAFDECNLLSMRPEFKNEKRISMENQGSDNLKGYALEFLREFPPNVGIEYFSSHSIEAIISDQEIDADEFNMWRILNWWVNKAAGAEEWKNATARGIVSHIDLHYIDPLQLNMVVKKCGFVSESDIEKALKQIDLMLANEKPEDKERVIVEGAGNDEVNGMYVLHEDEIGLKGDEVMYLKEGDEDLGTGDFGLFRLGETWGISNCTDYFNILYSCQSSRRKGHTLRKPPKWGWKSGDGAEPAPTCTWKPSANEDRRGDANEGFAPSLGDIRNEKKKGGRRTVHTSSESRGGHAMRSSLTLSQMMSLPEDASFLQESYQYASTAKDLDAMMNLAVDEGHDDEEGGYDVNYMSATAFMESSDFSGVNIATEKPSG